MLVKQIISILCIDRIYITRSNPLFIMTLQQLEYILAVSQFRHFAKAAEHCRVTQPTLSAMIQKLEDELDTKIFDRSQQPICPTPVGQLVIEQARIVLEQAGHIKDIIEEEKHSLSGVFKLGILPTIAPYLLPRFFPQLMKKYPKLDIRVTEMKTKDIKQALIKGEIDAGLICTRLKRMTSARYLYSTNNSMLISRAKANCSIIRLSVPPISATNSFGCLTRDIASATS